MQKQYIVRLSERERKTLPEVVKKVSGGGEKVRRARIFSKADVDGPAWSDSRIAKVFSCRRQTVEMLRERLVATGFQETLLVSTNFNGWRVGVDFTPDERFSFSFPASRPVEFEIAN